MLENEINRFRGVEIRIKELNQVIEAKELEISQWKNSYSDLTRQIDSYRILETKITESENRNQSLIKEIDSLNQSLEYQRQQLENYKKKLNSYEIEITHLRQYETKTQAYEEKIAIMTTEIERLNTLLLHRLQEIEQYKKSIQELNIQILTIRESHSEYESQYNNAQVRIK